MGSKKFKWNRWPKFRNQWRHALPYKSPVVMWKSEMVFLKYEDIDGQKVPVHMCRGISTRKIPKD